MKNSYKLNTDEVSSEMETGHKEGMDIASLSATQDAIDSMHDKDTLENCLATLASHYSNFIPKIKKSLFSFPKLNEEQENERIEGLQAKRDSLKRTNSQVLATLAKGRHLTIIVGLFSLWLFLSLLSTVGDLVILSTVFQMLTPNLLFSILLACGVVIALFVFPVLIAIKLSKTESPRTRKLIEWGRICGAITVFGLLAVVRSQYDDLSGDSHYGSSFLLFSINVILYLVQHLLARYLLLPTLGQLKPAILRYKELREVKKRKKDIDALAIEINNAITNLKLYQNLTQEAENEHPTLEDRWGRYYIQAVNQYKTTYRRTTDKDTDNWLNGPIPILNFLTKGSGPQTSGSKHRSGKSTIGYIYGLGVCLMFLFGSCSTLEKENSHFVGVLVDISDSIESAQTLTSQAVDCQLPDNGNSLQGVQIRIAGISDRKVTPMHILDLPAESALLSNSLRRKKEIRTLHTRIDSVLVFTQQLPDKPRSQSQVFYMVSMMLSEFQTSAASSGTIIIASDLLENSQVFNFYREHVVLMHQPDTVLARILSAYPPPTVKKPLHVVVLYQPPSVYHEGIFLRMAELLKRYLEHASHSITISVTPSL